MVECLRKHPQYMLSIIPSLLCAVRLYSVVDIVVMSGYVVLLCGMWYSGWYVCVEYDVV